MRNKTIEFYRFFTILIIAIFHFNAQYFRDGAGLSLWPKGGYLGVDFFFIISGMFLMYHFKSHDDSAYIYISKRKFVIYTQLI